MVEKTLSAQQANDNTTRYRTRYGFMTAPEAAQDLLYRTRQRLFFLEAILSTCGEEGKPLTLPAHSAHGLATILKDIAHDTSEACFYYAGVMANEQLNPYPGKSEE